jgi:glycosyltransferase involved in cell wall biosynthesis
MRILVLSHKPPYPIVDGGCLAMSRFLLDLCEMSRIQHIDYFTLSTHKHHFEPVVFQSLDLPKVTFQGIEIDTKLKVIPALTCLLTNQSYHTKRFLDNKVSKILVEKLRSESYDVVIFESLYAAIYTPIIREVFSGKICYRSHNLEYRIWEDLSKNEYKPLKAWYIRQLAKSLKKEELSIWKLIDCIFSISKEDAAIMERYTRKTVHYVPSSMPENGMEVKWNTNRICFLGAFDWEPNMEAMKWFIQEVFPLLLAKHPLLQFHIAGRKSQLIPNEWRGKNVIIHGFVENPLLFIAENGLFIASLQSGSGIKMKVLEAMSIGAPCVLTTKAAEGLSLDANMPIHKNKESYLSDILELLEDQSKQKIRGDLGKAYIQSAFSSKKVIDILEKELSSIA